MYDLIKILAVANSGLMIIAMILAFVTSSMKVEETPEQIEKRAMTLVGLVIISLFTALMLALMADFVFLQQMNLKG